jgi:hypothetical protein
VIITGQTPNYSCYNYATYNADFGQSIGLSDYLLTGVSYGSSVIGIAAYEDLALVVTLVDANHLSNTCSSNVFYQVTSSGMASQTDPMLSLISENLDACSQPVGGEPNVAAEVVISLWVVPGDNYPSCIGYGTCFEEFSMGSLSSPLSYPILTVYPDPTVSVTASSYSVDSGVSDMFTATVVGGYPSYTYTWPASGTTLPPGCAASSTKTTSTTSTYYCAISTAGSYTISVSVADSTNNAVGQTSGTSPTVTVDSTLGAAVVWDVYTPEIGLTFSFQGSAVYGTGTAPFTYSWASTPKGNTLNCAEQSATVTYIYICTPTSATSTTTTYTVTVTVNDADKESATGSLSFKVDPAPSVTKPAATPTTVDVGNAVTFSTTASGGDGIYETFNFVGLPPVSANNPCTTLSTSSASTDSISCTPITAGTYSITVTVTDSWRGVSAASKALSFTVYAALTATLSDKQTKVSGTSYTYSFTGTETGGSTTTKTYSLNFGDGTTKAEESGSHTYTCITDQNCYWTPTLTVTDPKNGNVASASVLICIGLWGPGTPCNPLSPATNHLDHSSIGGTIFHIEAGSIRPVFGSTTSSANRIWPAGLGWCASS